MAESSQKSPSKSPAKNPGPSKSGNSGKGAAVGKTNSSKGGKAAEKLECLDFTFDSRSKPITEQMLQLEEKRQKSFFSKKTKMPISEIEMLLERKATAKEMSKALTTCIVFYKRNEKEGEKFLEVLGRVLLDHASKEHLDFTRQKYLLYQAIDTFSTAVQYTAKRVNLTAEGMIVSTFKILSPINTSTFHVEKEIHKTITEMTQKKDLNDLESRDRIIKLYMQGKRYYEALYQLVEFEKIMSLKSRSMYLMKQGEIQFRKAVVFQHMIDFYLGVASSQEQKQIVGDMGKLRSFIHRFNLDNSRFKLTPITGTGPLAINKTLSSLIAVANVYYGDAASNNRFAHRHKAYFSMAHNNVMTDKIKAAIANLQAGIEAVAKSNLKAIDKGNAKLQLLEFIVKIYNEQGAPRKAEEYQKQLQELRSNVRAMESKKREEDAKRKELRGGK